MIILIIITNCGDTVKRIINSCIALLFILSTLFSASALDKAGFKLSSTECNISRLFDVEVIADGRNSLCAVTFEFTYDKSMFEFREAKSDNPNASIKANEKSDCVKVVYLCSDGVDSSSGNTIFTLTFKAIKAGTGYIDFNVYECVNQNVEFMNIDNCTSAKIVVNKSSDDNKSEDDVASGSSENSKRNKSDNGQSTRNGTNSDTTASQSTVDNIGTLNSVSSNKGSYIFIGILIGFAIIIVLSFAFLFGRKTANIKSNDKESNKQVL